MINCLISLCQNSNFIFYEGLCKINYKYHFLHFPFKKRILYNQIKRSFASEDFAAAIHTALCWSFVESLYMSCATWTSL